MPQARQRIVFCDCLDCVQQPATTDVASCTSPANEAAARQEPPPKCLIFVLSGVLLPRQDQQDPGCSTLLDSCNLPHLNRATAQGNLCLLTLRKDGTADSCTELTQLLNMYQEHQQGSTPTTLADRFKGLVSRFSSNSTAAQQLAASVGMSLCSILDSGTGAAGNTAESDLDTGRLDPLLMGAGRGGHAAAAAAADAAAGDSSRVEGVASSISHQLPDPAEAARRILQELGLQQADAGLDLLAVHLDLNSFLQQQQQQQVQQQPQQPQQQQQQQQSERHQPSSSAAAVLLGWLDKTLRYLNNSSAFKDAVLLTVLATPGSSQQPAAVPLLAEAGGTALSATAPLQHRAPPPDSLCGDSDAQQQDDSPPQPQQRRVFKPFQSFEQLAGQHLDVSHQRAILCLRRLPGVIRRDECTRFSLKDCCSNSGSLSLLTDRLLPEIAYKLGRAPKYGA